MSRFTYTTCLSFGADGSDNYTEIDATVSYVVAQGCCGSITAYGPVENSSDQPSTEDIQVEKIDGFDVCSSDAHTVEAILDKFETGEYDAVMLSSAMTAQGLCHELVQELTPDQGER